jgi:demethylmenaquinone methyltransferase/2-methoxy-6-polyprenyl-1,4-benzoquinol methylase
MTLGLDDRWRRRAVVETGLRPGDSVTDVCCGDGRLTALLAERVGPFGRVEGVDVSAPTVDAVIAAQHALVQAHFQVADAVSLPFPADTFDAATIAFGLRYLPDVRAALRELVRVVRPGGRVVILELALPRGQLRRAAYLRMCTAAPPVMARLMGGDAQAYRGLPVALETFPTPVALGLLMEQAGLADVTRDDLTTGVASLHRATVRYAVPGS